MDGSRTMGAGAWVRRLLGLSALAVWMLVLTKYGVTMVRGSSMEPTLASWDVAVYVRDVPVVHSGDIVLFEHEGWPGGVLHRVVARHPGGLLTTRGDANAVPDRDLLPRTKVRGVVCAVVPLGKGLRYVAESVRGCAILNRQSKSVKR